MEKLLLSINEASEVLGISRAFMYTHVLPSGLKSVKIGRRRMFRPVDLEQWALEQARESGRI